MIKTSSEMIAHCENCHADLSDWNIDRATLLCEGCRKSSVITKEKLDEAIKKAVDVMNELRK